MKQRTLDGDTIDAEAVETARTAREPAPTFPHDVREVSLSMVLPYGEQTRVRPCPMCGKYRANRGFRAHITSENCDSAQDARENSPYREVEAV